jgi:hypothetical protein
MIIRGDLLAIRGLNRSAAIFRRFDLQISGTKKPPNLPQNSTAFSIFTNSNHETFTRERDLSLRAFSLCYHPVKL